MKAVSCLILLGAVCGSLAEELNADQVRDQMRDVVSDYRRGLAKRSVLDSATFGVQSLASSFASNIGNKAALGASVSSGFNKQFTDSCLNSGGSSFPSFPTFGINNGISSGFNNFGSGIGSIVATKRAEDDKVANRDYVFVLDTSASIPDSQFQKAIEAIATLVEAFCPTTLGSAITSAGNKQVSVVMFGTRNTIDISFADSHKGLGYLKDKIRSLVHRRDSGTSTASALKFVKNSVLGRGFSRVNNAQVSTDVIVITDGQCNQQCSSLGVDADAVRSMGQGVNVFALGVANSRACELEIISGKGAALSYGLGDFQEFDKFAVAVAEIAKENPGKCA